LAGNLAEYTDTVNIDWTAPGLTAAVTGNLSGLPTTKNANSWYNDENGVTYSYTVSNAGISGLDAAASEVGDDAFNSEILGGTAYAKAQDLAGNVAEYTDTVNTDWTAPAITFIPPTGTYDSDIIVVFSATDNLSGFDAAGTLTAPNFDSYITLGDGTYSFTSQQISDWAGNTAQETATPFVISIPVPPVEAVFSTGLNERWRWPVPEVIDIYKAYPMDLLVRPVPVYFYHPLTTTDAAAFEDFQLTEDMYDFIAGKLQLKQLEFFSWFEEELKRKKIQK